MDKARELVGLIERGVFRVVDEQDLPESANVLGSRFVMDIKMGDDGQTKYKATLVVEGHADAEKNIRVHSSPTLLHISVRIIATTVVALDMQIWSPDISQAYL